MTRRRRLPRWCSEFRDRHGKVRVRFRRKGQEAHYFQATPWTDAFMQEYRACLDRQKAPAIEPGAARTVRGTMSDLIARYYAAPEFLDLAPSSRRTYRAQLDRFRQDHGEKRLVLLQRQHIKAIIGTMADRPAAANNLLDRIKVLMRFAVEIGLRRDNPTLGMRGFRLRSEGFHTWTEDEIAAFEAHHAIGTKPRLAMALLLYTGQRRSDVVAMGWQHVDRGRISVRQMKTKTRLAVPIHPELHKVLAGTPREDLAFLTTSFGKPFTAAGFGNWFRERCNDAGLARCTAHGLRKAAARRLAEAGCSTSEIKAITGHKTDAEVTRYTRDADQARLADQAMKRLPGGEAGTEMANPTKEVSQNDR